MMTLSIAKKPSTDYHNKKNRGASHEVVKSSHTVYSHPQTLLIQLKPICPCDGGCPRCTGVIQPKLTIGQPNDIYEQEADRVADMVMRMPKSGCPECEEEEELIQPKVKITPLVQRQVGEGEVSPGIESRINEIKGSGQPLPESVRNFFEPRFGYDFSQVRIHTDGQAVETTQTLNAHAFTVGQDIVFGTGQYAPGTAEGKRLLAHELAHVAQQEGSGSRRLEGQQIFRFVRQERTEIGDLDEAVDTASRVADNTGIAGLMNWEGFTTAMGGVGVIGALTSPKSGSTEKTPFPRYIYTCRCGLIDLRHFYQLMYIAIVRSEEAAVEKGIEHEETAEPESAFAPEDITSNALGAEFGSQRSWIQRQSTFVSALRSFLSRCEPVAWHRSVITPEQRNCIVDYYAVDASGGSHRRRTAGGDSDPCNICSGRTDFPFRTDKESGARIL